jgi:hypothetical protein
MENASRAFLDAVRKSMRQVRAAVGAATINPPQDAFDAASQPLRCLRLVCPYGQQNCVDVRRGNTDADEAAPISGLLANFASSLDSAVFAERLEALEKEIESNRHGQK